MEMKLAQRVLDLPKEKSEILFKPKQMEVIRRTFYGKPLNLNQKRYLRGDIKNKLDILTLLTRIDGSNQLQNLLYGIENYYITGYSALKENGFGWYFDPKRIIVINTRMEGTFHIPGKIVKLIRIKSLKNRSFTIEKKSGLRYATNEQIFKDAMDTNDEALLKDCRSHLRRYGDLFIEDHVRYQEEVELEGFEPEDFGV